MIPPSKPPRPRVEQVYQLRTRSNIFHAARPRLRTSVRRDANFSHAPTAPAHQPRTRPIFHSASSAPAYQPRTRSHFSLFIARASIPAADEIRFSLFIARASTLAADEIPFFHTAPSAPATDEVPAGCLSRQKVRRAPGKFAH